MKRELGYCKKNETDNFELMSLFPFSATKFFLNGSGWRRKLWVIIIYVQRLLWRNIYEKI